MCIHRILYDSELIYAINIATSSPSSASSLASESESESSDDGRRSSDDGGRNLGRLLVSARVLRPAGAVGVGVVQEAVHVSRVSMPTGRD